MRSDPRAEYVGRVAQWNDRLAQGERSALRLSNARLVTFLVGVAVAWMASGGGLLPIWSIGLPGVVFVALVVAHARALERNERAAAAKSWYLRGLERLDGRWMESGPDGARFLEGHPYARDLDLFGRASLFQLMSTARTEAGEDALAAWLSAPADIEEVHARQAAVRELTPLVDFREALAAAAHAVRVGRTSALHKWAAQAPAALPVWAAALFAVSGAGGVVLMIAALMGAVGTPPVVGWLIIQSAIVAAWRRPIAEVTRRVHAPSDHLGLLRELLAVVEREAFVAPRLRQLRDQIAGDGLPASRRIARLETLVSILNQYEHNAYFRAVAMPLLVRGQLAVGIDRWHAANRRQLVRWLHAVGELEAIASMATYAYEHPVDPFPLLVADGPVFTAAGLSHPLLPETAETPVVRNDVRIGGTGPRLLVVSGSNMSGKSTLLRSVGINVVLALAGAPVRASSLTLSCLALGATIKIEDSLQAGHSRFYAEILRIRAIVEAARGPRRVLFLLDEVLHGTNSHDRRVGAEAVVKALVDAGAIGLLTTHDLALTELVDRLDGRAANVHFADRLENGRLVFDYRMRPGVVEHSNALELMRAVGLLV
jgi:hypothetical protein